MPGVGADDPVAIPSLLNDQGGQTDGSDGPADSFKIPCQQVPCSRRVSLGRIESQGDHKVGRSKQGNFFQGLAQDRQVLFPRQFLGEGEIDVASFAGSFPGFILKSAEIGIGKAGMAVDGDGQDVGAVVEDDLSRIATGPTSDKSWAARAALLK